MPTSFIGVIGWFAAGLTVALQRIVTAAAGGLIIRINRVFRPGDRITIGGVRGDVIKLGVMQTTVLEMGQAPGEQDDDPSVWIKGRQFTGRIVRVTNDKVFDSPVYNYTTQFPYMWEEIVVPVRYGDPRDRVEGILLDVARRNTESILADARPRMEELCRAYRLEERPNVEPAVYYRLTDNWVELSVRFLTRDRGARDVKDRMTREILDALQAEKISVASATFGIVELPPLSVRRASEDPPFET